MKQKGRVIIRGREYKTVALRVAEFRERFPIEDGWGICTQIVCRDDTRVVILAQIHDPNDRVVGSGFAEELRTAAGINATSALENCETSAIGRALASVGLGGSEYASANEVSTAIAQQEAAKRAPPDDSESVAEKAAKAFAEASDDIRRVLKLKEGLTKRYEQGRLTAAEYKSVMGVARNSAYNAILTDIGGAKTTAELSTIEEFSRNADEAGLFTEEHRKVLGGALTEQRTKLLQKKAVTE